ncbi:amino acid adenylation domain-containing protein [Pseudomonas sp. Marseille-Q1929]|uniref:amino acid adenylation domain-containing protein n=1 Tax=Pseudomonas sp. Marseille-Q1929 TaxID=2730402 RepID=UPI001A8FCD34|nr:amino acid adenylation domain-containing protein [Pseudomonas sp. Marseille-Q1929]MBO0497054.1 amino acid adenylation domain-containing protein [Pseudomonas sp. Marseille-Q1929]
MSTDTVVSLFERQALKSPNANAVVGLGDRITYLELDRRSTAIANYLRSLQIGRGDWVLVQAHRSVELVIALLGVLKSGAAYVPVDRELPLKRKEYIAQQCRATLVLCTDAHAPSPVAGCEVRTVREIVALNTPAAAQAVTVAGADLMYMIFTSGTTGAPKGVMVEHHSVVELLVQHNANLQVDGASRCTLMASVGFDVSQAEIWSALITGACLYELDQDALLNSAAFLGFCATHRITHAFVPTMKVYDVVNATQPPGLCLKYVYTAGEKLHPVRISHLGWRLADCYGPTEATIYVTWHQVQSAEQSNESIIGHPIANASVHIMDDQGVELAQGEIGELCIAGSCLARGYLNAPELTAERFFYSSALKRRVYRSGDQARALKNGDIEFLGRKDGQIKIRGYRVEIGEIEAYLLKHPGIGSVAVAVWEGDSQADKRLIAFVVARNKTTHGDRLVASIRRSAENDLPSYMVPDRFISVDALPSNANGKTDKLRLLASFKGLKPAVLDLQRFDGKTQQALAKVWFELLGHANFGAGDNFLEVGGHSLRVAQLSSMLTEHFAIPVSIRTIYEHLAFGALADYLQKRLAESGHGPGPDDVAEFEQDVYLPPGFKVRAPFDPTQLSSPRHILLTGVTGFVGIHLLQQLLASHTAAIHCVIRCEDALSGVQRLQQIAERYEIPLTALDWARIHVYPGDLSEELLGIEQERYQQLARRVDCVIHSASAVNFIMPYSYMQRDNVQALRRILDFCTAHKTKCLCLMSTISVYSWGHRFTHKQRAYERSSIDVNLPAIRHDLGYVQSKWVMEKITDLAHAAGLPVMTFRLGYAMCHSRSGLCADYQWWGRFIKTCLRYGAVPDIVALREGLATVDYMTKGVVCIARNPQAVGKKFNMSLSGRKNLDLSEFCRRAGDFYGRSFKVIPYKEWVSLWADDVNAWLYPLRGMFTDDMYKGMSIIELYQNTYRWGTGNARRFLRGRGIHEPDFSGEVLARYLERLERVSVHT